MAYSDQIIDQVQSLNDIVEVITSYVPLKRAGRSFKASCPFHQEKTPSFIVNPEKQIFRCFGCGVGGDVFSFVMKYEQLNFPEALKRLAERVHVTLPESKPLSSRERSQTERLLQIYAQASEFYHANLLDPETGQIGRDYLSKRSFGTTEIKEFRLGFAPSEWRRLYDHLSNKGFSEQDLITSGLVQRSTQGTIYDLFRNRIMFPIQNRQGKVIAFGGRVLGDEMPKYLNSPESALFRKRAELYALSLAIPAIARFGDLRRILIVEGYLDCIRMHASGFRNVVATLGTSLTQDHVRVLKRYADEAVVLFDGDRAGEEASLRGLDIFLEEGMTVKILCLPKGFDPDDFIRLKGVEEMKTLLSQAQDVFDFKLQVLLTRYNKSDSLGLLKITGELLDTFSKIENPVLVDRYLKRMAQALGVEETSLRSELNKLRAKQNKTRFVSEMDSTGTGRRARSRSVLSAPLRAVLDVKEGKEPPVEKLLLCLMLHYPPYLQIFSEAFPGYVIQGPRCHELFELLVRVLREQDAAQISSSKLLNRIQSEELKAFASELLMMEWNSGEDRELAFYDLLRKLKEDERANRLEELRSQISKAENAGNQELVLKYVKAYQELLSQPQGN